MLTYDRGQWSDDSSISDDDPKITNNVLQFHGFETDADWTLGVEHSYQVDVYWATDYRDAKYKFFVVISHINRFEWFLVTDYPSLVMLIKDLEPTIRLEMDKLKLEYLTEEHQWMMKDKGLQRDCDHL